MIKKFKIFNENIQEMNTESEDTLICPYCGYVQDDDPENIMSGGGLAPEYAECECEECGKTYEASKTVIVTYCTQKI
ncbi:hypothetical protein M0Q50_04005 [bacterium]|jgi:hypothetical protein|nr:hypothetical protein [bacterium]